MGRHQSLYRELTAPPVPVERIVEDVLDLSILWDEIPEPQGQSVLAALEPHSPMVIFNESQIDLDDPVGHLLDVLCLRGSFRALAITRLRRVN